MFKPLKCLFVLARFLQDPADPVLHSRHVDGLPQVTENWKRLPMKSQGLHSISGLVMSPAQSDLSYGATATILTAQLQGLLEKTEGFVHLSPFRVDVTERGERYYFVWVSKPLFDGQRFAEIIVGLLQP